MLNKLSWCTFFVCLPLNKYTDLMDAKDNGHLQSFCAPSHMELCELKHWKCAHVEQVGQFLFNMTWTHKQVDDCLHCIVFPISFEYLERTEKGKHKDGSPGWQWILIHKKRQHYEAICVTEPTGANLAQYCGCPGCAILSYPELSVMYSGCDWGPLSITASPKYSDLA